MVGAAPAEMLLARTLPRQVKCFPGLDRQLRGIGRPAPAAAPYTVRMRRPVTLCALLLSVATGAAAWAHDDPVPPPKVDAPLAGRGTSRKAVVAGGCFWGVEAVYRQVRGVTRAVSGYAGGAGASAHYEIVSTGRTAHSESVEVTYDASKVTYGQLLHVFFSVAHDPTELNRQGPDVGRQYRSAIFFSDKDQERIARAYIAQLDSARVFGKKIATEVVALPAFYPAEDYHQDYVARNPGDPYVMFNDAPKLNKLKALLPDLFVERR
jgi:peptide-methionine (S)-S-oxide reductase